MATILFVEDNETIAKRISKELGKEHKVIHCSGGEGALEILKSKKYDFDLAIITFLLKGPAWSGAHLLSNLRQIDGLSRLEVIFVKGFEDDKSIQEPIWTRGYKDNYIEIIKSLHTTYFPGETVDELIKFVYKTLATMKEQTAQRHPKTRQRKILLAEDDERVQKVFKELLQDAGYQVYQAFDGEQAIDLIEKEEIEAMILDIEMPKKNGFEVLKWVKWHEKERIKNLKVIICSVHVGEQPLIPGYRIPSIYVMEPSEAHDFQSSLKIILDLLDTDPQSMAA